MNNIEKINNFLKEQFWMDFEFSKIGRGSIELYGFLDESGENMIKIIFELPYMMMSPLAFTYEGEGEFISVIEGDEAYSINGKYNVIRGNNIYRLSNINIEGETYIISKGLKIDYIKY